MLISKLLVMLYKKWLKIGGTKVKEKLNNILKVFLVCFLVMAITVKDVWANEITAIDFNGELIGRVIPDGSVVGLNNQIIGNITADSFIVNSEGDIIGGVVPQGIAIGNDNKFLGKVNNDGTIRLPSGKIIGKVLPTSLVINDNYEIIGSILFPGLIYDDNGKTVGRLTGDGLYISIDGQNIGMVSSMGYAYKHSGSGYVLDGRLVSSKMVVSADGSFIGSVSPGGQVTDFDAKVIGSLRANGYVYNKGGEIIGKTVSRGYAFDNLGSYLGLVTYNGEVVNKTQVVGKYRADNKIVNDEGTVIGFFVDIASTATDFKGKYIGRIMPEGKVARATDNIGKVGPRGMVYDNSGKVIGKISYSGPFFDYLGNIKGLALRNGTAISLTGTPVGYVKGNEVYDNIGRILGAGIDKDLIINVSDDVLGLRGLGADFTSSGISYKISPFGYVYSSDNMLTGNTIDLSAIYDESGNENAYIGLDGKVKGVAQENEIKLTQFGIAITPDNKIYGNTISPYFAYSFSENGLVDLAENNLVTDGKGNITGKVVPEYKIVETSQSVSENMMPVTGDAVKSFLAVGFDGNMLGYLNYDGKVYNYSGNVVGKIIGNSLVLDNNGSIIGRITEFNSVINNSCEFLGVISPRGDVRNNRDVIIGKVLENGQVISDVGVQLGFTPKKGSVIDFKGNIIGNVNGLGKVLNYANNDVGCIKGTSRLYDSDNVLQGAVVEPSPVMNFKNVIIGRILSNGKAVDLNNNIIGYSTPDGSVISDNGKVLGIAFKYRFAFDNDNNFMGFVNEKAEVVNANNDVLAKVNYDGMVVSKRKDIGYALYDVYIYDDNSNVLGLIGKGGNVTSFAGVSLGRADRGFLIDKNYQIIGRGNRDYFVRDLNDKVIGELHINGSITDNENDVIGKILGSGEVRDAEGKLVAKARYLQYYNIKKITTVNKPAEKKEPEIKMGEITIPEKVEEPIEEDDGIRFRYVGIATTPDGDYIGKITDTGDVVNDKGEIVGRKTKDGLVLDNSGNLKGIAEITKNITNQPYMPPGEIDPTAHRVGDMPNTGPGGGYEPGGRYDPLRIAGINAVHNLRREEFTVGKLSSNVSKEAFDGYASNWEGVQRKLSSWRVDMSEMILADKPIPAVLARTIMSGAEGVPVTAIVERNVYAEEGRNIVIPAGSRVMGEMRNFQGGGSTGSAVRVDISWTRLIRPDGSAFEFSDATTGDAQGRAGALGYIDEQLLKKYTLPIVTSTLTSAITYLAAAGESSQNSDGESTQDAKAEAADDARENFVEDMRAIFQKILSDKTDISAVAYVPAGTRLIIYPKVDLWIRTAEREQEQQAEKETGKGPFLDNEEDKPQGQKSGSSGNLPTASRGSDSGAMVQVMGTETEEPQPVGGVLISEEAPKKRNRPSAPIYNGGATPPPPSTGASFNSYNNQKASELW